MLVDQAVALERVADLLDAAHFRADRHQAWSAMLATVVHRMDWETGLATVTREVLAEAGGVDVRTVTTMLRWAREVGLLAVVEAGASAAFLGTCHNRAQTYALIVPTGTVPARQPDEAPGADPAAPPEPAPHAPPDLRGDTRIHPPTSYVGNRSLEERQKDQKTSRRTEDCSSWPLWQVPETPEQRSAATQKLADRLGLGRRVPPWRLRALLACWWRAGACVAGLLHALDRHPDHPNTPRGDTVRGAHDPIRVLGYRLTPWLGRLDELPAHLRPRRGDYQRAQADRLAADMARAELRAQQSARRPTASRQARDAAHQALAAARAARRGPHTMTVCRHDVSTS